MTSILGAQPFNPKKGFWKRQFSDSTTKSQLAFDIIFGIVMPVICFYFDPGIINGGFRGDSYLSLNHIAISIYLFSALAILGLLFWLVLRHQAERYAALLGGLFISAAIFSFIVGALMLPVTLIGLIFIIGVLGFVPFATGHVFLRYGMRAINRATTIYQGRRPTGMIVTSALLAISAPFILDWQVGRAANRSIDEIINSRSGYSQSAVNTAKHLRWFANTDALVWAYASNPDADRQDRLANAYREITGRNIEDRLGVLND